jgi:6-phosphogluconolactonase/glucosamine-6-phosphate isomerase/deaminase
VACSQNSNDGYSLEPTAHLDPPDLPGIVELTQNLEDALDLLSADLMVQALDCTHRFGEFQLALSGSPQLEPLCRRLIFDPDLRRFPWGRTHLWIGDDRCVPWHDPSSCVGRLRESLIEPAGIPMAHVHIVPSTDEAADERIDELLRHILDARTHGAGRLDCAVLDVGPDGRVGGLFPGDDAVLETTRQARFTNSSADVYPNWVSLTLPVFNAARMTAVVGAGPETIGSLRRLAACPLDPRDFPAAGLHSDDGILKWYLSHEDWTLPTS